MAGSPPDTWRKLAKTLDVNSPFLRNFATTLRLETRYNSAMSRPAIEIDDLNVVERLELIESLWESLVVDPSNVPVTNAQKQLLDARLDEIDRGDDTGIPWDEVKARIIKRLS